MEALKLKRAGLRTSFTRTVNVLKPELGKVDSNLDIIKDKFCKLQNLQLELKDLDDEILNLLTADTEKTSEVEVNKELEAREVYSDDFILLSRQYSEKMNSDNDSKSDVSSILSSNKLKSYKLPKIELKKFDGELINFLPFWSQFQKIHEDPELHKSDKFCYLIQSMKQGTRAKDFIDSYPVTSDNYEKAVDALRERFGNSELLIEVYVRELIKLIISNVKADKRDKLPLDQLYDKIEAQLRALESLGLKSNENTSWLFPMVESSLSDDVLKAWQRSSYFNTPEGNELSRLTNLMKFLKAEVEGEERLKLARSGFENANGKESHRDRARGEMKGNFKSRKPPNIATAAGFFASKDRSCIFCCKAHDTKSCSEARVMSLDEKIAKIKEKKLCLKCLEPSHIAKNCRRYVQCYACGKAHLIFLCPKMHVKSETIVEKENAEHLQTATAGQVCTAEVALMTLRVKVAGINKVRNVRVLLDCGSQKSYILKSLATELGLPEIAKETIAHTLFGGAKTDPKLHNKYRVKLCASNQHKFDLEFDFLDQDIICGDIPRIQKGPILKELKRNKIWLSDMGSDFPKIEMLIGSDIYGKILTGLVKQLNGGLTAVCTKLGWAVCGKFDDFPTRTKQNTSILCANLAVRDFKISDIWNLETIGILDAKHDLTKVAEEELVQEQFLHSLSKNEEGRYCVGLPWLVHNVELPTNRHVAEKRLFGVTRKLRSLNKYDEYNNVFKEWMNEGVIEVVPEHELHIKGHYLPHHPVFKPDSITTKIRPVFDASCKVGRSPSLNDCLFKGPNLIEEIPSILLRFREKCIGVTSDIRRAFLQIELKKEDRDFLRFLWWEKENIIKILRHTRVVFGVTSSPFLLGAVIAFHLSQVSPEERLTAQKLDRSLYMDNCVTSVDNEEELVDFIKCSTAILAKAKMDLRLWTFGPVVKDIELRSTDLDPESILEDQVSVLGVLWDRKVDNLSISIKTESVSENLTKREILSLTQTIYDPLGFVAPVVLLAKLMLQEIWTIKVDWDTPLPEEIKKRFLKWYNDLKMLCDLKLPRRLGFGDKSFWELHVFCDASQNAYATVIFLRCEHNEEIFLRFVAAKSRVAPLKAFSIPRLELMACVLGVRLSKYVTEALSLENNRKYFWTDSTTALSWIGKNDLWGTFVGNRVKEICTLSKPSQWAYVPGQWNPADLPSRGCSPLKFSESDWWNGPVWLKGPSDSWPKLEIRPDESIVLSELRKGAKLNVIVNLEVNSRETKWYEKFSKFSKMVRVLGWVKRFANNCLKLNDKRESFLSTSEISKARVALLLLVQMESFPENSDSVHGLMAERDQNGLIRVKTKIIDREDDYEFKYPVILPSKHHIVECLVMEFHENNSHAGIQALMAILREEFWILSSRRTVRRILNKCVRCKRFTAKAPSTDPVQLPRDRVCDAAVFQITGIDLCGPLILRDKTKSWVVLFTCAVYRAVHLELVSSISTDCFLQAFRRFVSRRGRPQIIYSDNGTNFQGMSTILRKINWEKVVKHQTLQPIEWKFIPPTAAWWGGWWERLIRSTKELIVRVLGRSSITYEELYTVLCDVEAVLNNRPLTYISNDISDLTPLTPSMFLQDLRSTGVPEIDYIDRDKLLARQKLCRELREQFRSRFRKEYLGHLVQKAGRGTCQIEVGDMVLIGADNQKRIHWPIARVQELLTGRDGRVRVVKVKTQNGVLLRPVRRLYPLEVRSSESFDLKNKCKRWECGENV